MHTVIVPINQLSNRPIPAPVMLIEVKPLLNLTISLRMIHTTQKLLYAFLLKKTLKRMVSVAIFVSFIGKKLGSMIS
ncbi:MAG: hypothetical protein ACQXXJ_01225, partial [Candidatus Bathyarchaeia archaeon]